MGLSSPSTEGAATAAPSDIYAALDAVYARAEAARDRARVTRAESIEVAARAAAARRSSFLSRIIRLIHSRSRAYVKRPLRRAALVICRGLSLHVRSSASDHHVRYCAAPTRWRLRVLGGRNGSGA